MSVVHAPTYQWTVDEFEKLGEAGIFDEDDRVELLNGEIESQGGRAELV